MRPDSDERSQGLPFGKMTNAIRQVNTTIRTGWERVNSVWADKKNSADEILCCAPVVVGEAGVAAPAPVLATGN